MKVDLLIIYEKDVIVKIKAFDWSCHRLKPLHQKEVEKDPHLSYRWYENIEVETEID